MELNDTRQSESKYMDLIDQRIYRANNVQRIRSTQILIVLIAIQ